MYIAVLIIHVFMCLGIIGIVGASGSEDEQ